MFCKECGAKNAGGVKFCEKCGHAMDVKKAPKMKVTVTKKTKIISALVVAVLIIFIGGFLFIKNSISPEKEAIKYFKAVMNQDVDKLYDYVDAKDSKLTTKKVFKEIFKANKNDLQQKSELLNYKVKETNEIANLNKIVTISYVTSLSTTPKEVTINFVKAKNKKFLFFDNWKIVTDEVRTVDSMKLKVLKGSTVTVAGVELGKSELNKSKSTKSFDVYDLPSMFKANYPVKVALPLGFVIEDSIYPSSYSKTQTIDIDEDKLNNKSKKELSNAISKNLKVIYEGAIAKKDFNDIKNNFVHKDIDLKNIEKSYNSFSKSLNSSTRQLTNIKFKEVEIRSLDVTSDGQLEIYFKFKYDYSLKYKSGSEEKNKTADSYSYAYMDFNYDKGYNIVDFKSLDFYFY